MTGETPTGADCSPIEHRSDQIQPAVEALRNSTPVVSQDGMTISVIDLRGRVLAITPRITADRIDIGVGKHVFSIRYALYVADVIRGMANAVSRPGIPRD